MTFVILVIALVLAFLSLLGSLVKGLNSLAIIGNLALAGVLIWLTIRVRVKMTRKEKENLRARIDELEKKIESITKK